MPYLSYESKELERIGIMCQVICKYVMTILYKKLDILLNILDCIKIFPHFDQILFITNSTTVTICKTVHFDTITCATEHKHFIPIGMFIKLSQKGLR